MTDSAVEMHIIIELLVYSPQQGHFLVLNCMHDSIA